MMPPSDHARVIVVVKNGDVRYFCSFGKAGRVQTAWSLAGAKLFLDDLIFTADVRRKLEKKGYKVMDVAFALPKSEMDAVLYSLGGKI